LTVTGTGDGVARACPMVATKVASVCAVWHSENGMILGIGGQAKE
jgi:hypothetical protein